MSTSSCTGGCKECTVTGSGDVCADVTIWPNYDAEGNQDPNSPGDVDVNDNGSIENYLDNQCSGSHGKGFKNNQASQDAKDDAKNQIKGELTGAALEKWKDSTPKPTLPATYKVCMQIDIEVTIYSDSKTGGPCHGSKVKIKTSNENVTGPQR